MPITPALFSCSPIPNGVSVIAVAASKDQSLALANMWYHSRAVGTFRQFVTKESSELRVLGTTLAAVQGALAGVTVESLLPYVKAIEQSRDDAQIKANEDKELKSMSLEEFGRLLCRRSGEKLRLVHGMQSHASQRLGIKTIHFQSVALMPVTHFKEAARLAKYVSAGRLFAYSEDLGSDLTSRQKLLSLADKISRSTKKVTKEDIAARRASRLTYGGMPTQEEIEDFIYDVFGHGVDDPEHIAAAIKGLTTPSRSSD